MDGNSLRHIPVKAMCIIKNGDKILVNRGYDSVKKETFHRLIGGKVEFGEETVETVKREIKEEINSAVEDLKFVVVQEEIFTYNGEKGHEIVFIYKGRVSDKKILDKELIVNPDSEGFPAVWISVADVLNKKLILYPSIDYGKFLSE